MHKGLLWIEIVGAVLLLGGVFWLIAQHIDVTSTHEQGGKVEVSTSFYPLAFFAQEIGGTYADVFNITPAGAEPHDYEPTAQDMARIERSALVVLNGGGLEAWSQNVQDNASKNTFVVVAGEGLTDQMLEENGHHETDPHVWLSPPLAVQMVQKISEGFIRVDPSHAEAYQKNTTALIVRLHMLDQAYHEGLAHCANQDIITSHAAFGYLARTYGLTQVPIAGLSPDAEPSANTLVQIASFAKQHNVHYIFFESLVSPKLANTLAQEVGATTLELNPLEGLTKEELQRGDNYFTIMERNLAQLQKALLCTH
ncbi:MAG: zinc ABC transporter substrate-binding protein [Patescibacteria group bacterium]|nr:zinc ABC transporter substrate-binding protein [Patescibacteria group bacterium]MDE2438342.1 zinc ABC transporter substrate-binding protein [Patescibacteria group bacterium]